MSPTPGISATALHALLWRSCCARRRAIAPMLGIFQHIDRALERWARRKYKALHRRKAASVGWLDKMQSAEPLLFHRRYATACGRLAGARQSGRRRHHSDQHQGRDGARHPGGRQLDSEPRHQQHHRHGRGQRHGCDHLGDFDLQGRWSVEGLYTGGRQSWPAIERHVFGHTRRRQHHDPGRRRLRHRPRQYRRARRHAQSERTAHDRNPGRRQQRHPLGLQHGQCRHGSQGQQHLDPWRERSRPRSAGARGRPERLERGGRRTDRDAGQGRLPGLPVEQGRQGRLCLRGPVGRGSARRAPAFSSALPPAAST